MVCNYGPSSYHTCGKADPKSTTNEIVNSLMRTADEQREMDREIDSRAEREGETGEGCRDRREGSKQAGYEGNKEEIKSMLETKTSDGSSHGGEFSHDLAWTMIVTRMST